MATRTAASVAQANAHARLWKWEGLLNGDVGSSISFPQSTDRSVQVTGTFGAGGSLNIVGSNDGGTTWAVLTDPQGNALTFTATKIEAISELPALIRPEVIAGDGTTDLDVFIFMAGSIP